MRNQGVMLQIRGKVQGVGFRPYVWQIASEMGLAGDVCNDGSGVIIRLADLPEAFVAALYQRCPPLARIDSLENTPMQWDTLPDNFTIRASDAGAMSTQIVPDAATCPACLAEMQDPARRRYRYPFINCTHCGPRFTIIRAMPYDRPFTVMAGFPLCAACEAEYRDPYDRRFHAQPVACPDCGPQLSWVGSDSLAEREGALQAALAALRAGKIVAVKGVGGFHLACDAGNDSAVALLRQRKHRPAKPLAVMLTDDSALPEAARALLRTPAAPIVLVAKTWCGGLSDAIAPGLNEVGVMLPGNPLQHLLSRDFGKPLVMTSGNLSGRPPALTNPQALADLRGLADGWLLHNRDILQRMDDSLVREDGSMLRRARGFVPDTLPLPPGFTALPPLLCLGADLKNTFALARGDHLVLSQHLGDLAQEGVEAQWRQALALMCQVYDFTPQQLVLDAHPGYQLTRIGREMSHERGLPVHEVLHHHAHIAACLAEHQWPLDGGPVIGLALDGIGMGASGELWGGECLRADYRQCDKLGGLPAVALPGGDLAARQPWRNLLAHCLRFVPDWDTRAETAVIRQQMWQPLAKAIERSINAPLASSAGRLFDAAAAALGCTGLVQSYEGEAACRLEAMAWQHGPVNHPVTLPCRNGQLDLAVFWQGWLDWQAAPAARAWAFHDALAAGLAALARCHATAHGLNTVACGGGVWHNRLLSLRLRHYLPGFTLLFPHTLPAGDGAVSVGQAVIAAARILVKG